MELVLLALALSSDAFAVALTLGIKKTKLLPTACYAAFYFGLFQGLMPLIGFFMGKESASLLDPFGYWIACTILAALGCKMVRDSFAGNHESLHIISHKKFLLLALATSIDALAVGFTLPLLGIALFISIAVIASVTFALSFCGVYIGAMGGSRYESRAHLFGGVILIAISLKIIFTDIL
ncbi:MAG: manganese efflux pump MntP family protein [Campylobacteraceae bacterium]|jgi:putative Mn2+ efflux pump MntP|nr:manganese efflux pump MntP family protein [Campylobacteraceae bacterium]